MKLPVTTARVTTTTLLVLTGIGLTLAALSSSRFEAQAQRASRLEKPRPDLVAPPSCPAIAFSHSTIVDFSATSGEPFINSAPVDIPPNTPKGSPFISAPFGVSTTVSILWKSVDGGRSFIQ